MGVVARAMLPSTVDPLVLSISNPPTQGQVQAIVEKLNELLGALKG